VLQFVLNLATNNMAFSLKMDDKIYHVTLLRDFIPPDFIIRDMSLHG